MLLTLLAIPGAESTGAPMQLGNRQSTQDTHNLITSGAAHGQLAQHCSGAVYQAAFVVVLNMAGAHRARAADRRTCSTLTWPGRTLTALFRSVLPRGGARHGRGALSQHCSGVVCHEVVLNMTGAQSDLQLLVPDQIPSL